MILSFVKYTAFNIIVYLLPEHKVLGNVNIIKQKTSFTTYLIYNLFLHVITLQCRELSRIKRRKQVLIHFKNI